MLLVAVVVTALLGVMPLPASGCSCAPPENPRASLAATAGAFVGVLERIDSDSDDGATFHYRVEHAVKGVTGDTVSIFSQGDSASCGLGGSLGRRVGMLLGRNGDEWTASSCSDLGAERLLEATRPLPPPDGRGPPAFVVGSGLGEHRSMLLDSQGRTLAYGAGPSPDSGDVTDIAVCPHGRRVIEAMSPTFRAATPVLTVRALDGFAVERQVTAGALPGVEGPGPYVRSVRCRGPAAEAIDLIVRHTRTSVYRLEKEAWRVVWQGDAEALLAGPTSAVVWWTDRIERLDLATGALAPIHQQGSIATVSPSPDGRLVAVTTRTPDYHLDRLLLVEVATGEVRASQAFQAPAYVDRLVWVDDRTVASVESEGSLVVRDRNLRTVATAPGWHGYRLHSAGGHVYGTGFETNGLIVEATVAHPTARPWVRLPDGATFAIVALPPPKPPKPPRPLSTTSSSTSTSTTTTTTAPSPPPTDPPGPDTAAAAPPMAPAGSSRPWAPAAVAMLLLMAVATVARHSVRRSG